VGLRGALVVVSLAAALAACAGPAPSVPVTAEAQAIAIAKDRCAWTRPFEADERWHGARHEGLWHVWLVRDSDPREPAVGVLDIWIGAADGKAGSCNRAY
jgi:hypothetical protein